MADSRHNQPKKNDGTKSNATSRGGNATAPGDTRSSHSHRSVPQQPAGQLPSKQDPTPSRAPLTNTDIAKNQMASPAEIIGGNGSKPNFKTKDEAASRCSAHGIGDKPKPEDNLKPEDEGEVQSDDESESEDEAKDKATHGVGDKNSRSTHRVDGVGRQGTLPPTPPPDDRVQPPKPSVEGPAISDDSNSQPKGPDNPVSTTGTMIVTGGSYPPPRLVGSAEMLEEIGNQKRILTDIQEGLRRKVKEFHDRHARDEDKCKELREQLDRADANIAKLRAAVAQLTSENQDYRKKIDQLQEDNKNCLAHFHRNTEILGEIAGLFSKMQL